MNTLFSTYYLPVTFWTVHFAFLAFGLTWTEWYKWRSRVKPHGAVARLLAW